MKFDIRKSDDDFIEMLHSPDRRKKEIEFWDPFRQRLIKQLQVLVSSGIFFIVFSELMSRNILGRPSDKGATFFAIVEALRRPLFAIFFLLIILLGGFYLWLTSRIRFIKYVESLDLRK